MRIRSKLILMVAALALTAACGGDEGRSGGGSPTTTIPNVPDTGGEASATTPQPKGSAWFTVGADSHDDVSVLACNRLEPKGDPREVDLVANRYQSAGPFSMTIEVTSLEMAELDPDDDRQYLSVLLQAFGLVDGDLRLFGLTVYELDGEWYEDRPSPGEAPVDLDITVEPGRSSGSLSDLIDHNNEDTEAVDLTWDLTYPDRTPDDVCYG